MDEAVAVVAEQIRAAAAGRQPLRVRAGGSKDFYGNTPRGTVLDPRAARGIISYEPTELALTVRCGTPLAELEAALDAHGQMLAFEPPHYGETATIGGCIGSGFAGPRPPLAGYSFRAAAEFALRAPVVGGRG